MKKLLLLALLVVGCEEQSAPIEYSEVDHTHHDHDNGVCIQTQYNLITCYENDYYNLIDCINMMVQNHIDVTYNWIENTTCQLLCSQQNTGNSSNSNNGIFLHGINEYCQ